MSHIQSIEKLRDGFGSISVNAKSMVGIGQTDELGHVNELQKLINLGCREFELGEGASWTRFRGLWEKANDNNA